jgi:GNAT superfamily N-acetyltransferase
MIRSVTYRNGVKAVVTVAQLTDVSERAAADINVLAVQLKSDARPLNLNLLRQVIEEPNRLYVAYDGDRIVGMAMLVVNIHPVRTRAWLEDFVVDERYRRQGLGRRLATAVIAAAREHGAPWIDLTSGRPVAHILYRSLGFVQRPTTVFRLLL